MWRIADSPRVKFGSGPAHAVPMKSINGPTRRGDHSADGTGCPCGFAIPDAKNGMNHELAKDLKAAEFPQAGNGTTYVDLLSKDSFYVPTLEELLEACVELMKPKEPIPRELISSNFIPIWLSPLLAAAKFLVIPKSGVWGGRAEHLSAIFKCGTTISARPPTKP
jgi:hypothetical protein